MSCFLLGIVNWTLTPKLRQSLVIPILTDWIASEADSVQRDALSVASEPEADVLNYQGPWILNTLTGWFHPQCPV